MYMLVADRHALAELKLTEAQLARHFATMNPQLREYLKCRLYLNICEVRMRPEFFTGPLAEVDYGPVDLEVLNGVSAIKGPESPDDLYRDAMAKVGGGTAHIHEMITVREIAALKTVSAAESFATSHKMRFSKMSIDQMRAQKMQIPAYAGGAVGRLQTVLWLDGAEAVTYVDFYHDEGGHVINTYVHVEPQNN